jgi:hypothetical protein
VAVSCRLDLFDSCCLPAGARIKETNWLAVVTANQTDVSLAALMSSAAVVQLNTLYCTSIFGVVVNLKRIGTSSRQKGAFAFTSRMR